MSEHTPTPWFADRDDRPNMGWNVHIVREDDPRIRICFMTSGSEAKANAALIVRAVNSHADLVKALTEITQRANESGTGDAGLLETIHAMHGIARKALAKVQHG
jgi:hypothetical protein